MFYLGFSLSFLHVIFLDLSLMEERPSRGQTLERHDEPSTHCRCPMARSQSLMAPPTKSKQHLQNPVDMHKFKHGYQKPSNFLFLSFSVSLPSQIFLQFGFGDPTFIHNFYFFSSTKKWLSTAKKTGRESLVKER